MYLMMGEESRKRGGNLCLQVRWETTGGTRSWDSKKLKDVGSKAERANQRPSYEGLLVAPNDSRGGQSFSDAFDIPRGSRGATGGDGLRTAGWQGGLVQKASHLGIPGCK